MRKVLTSACILVGCCVGVGMLSGKEILLYLPNTPTVVAFCVAFCMCLGVILHFCQQNGVQNLQQLCQNCFGKFANAVQWLVVLCNFLCIVCGITTCCNCLKTVVNAPFPLLELAICALATVVLCNAKKALGIVNLISLAVAFVFCLCLPKTTNYLPQTVNTPQLAVYTMFSVAMILPVIGNVWQGQKRTWVCAVVASVIIATIALFVRSRCNFNLEMPLWNFQNDWQKVLACIAVCLATTTCLVANAIPVCQYLQDLLPNKLFCAMAIFCVATLFSTTGLDRVFAFCYPAVAVVGALFLVATVTKKDCKNCNLSS